MRRIIIQKLHLVPIVMHALLWKNHNLVLKDNWFRIRQRHISLWEQLGFRLVHGRFVKADSFVTVRNNVLGSVRLANFPYSALFSWCKMQVPTFPCIIGKDRASSCLFALCIFSRAGMGAERPWGPGAQGTVLWARHLTDGRHRQYGITTELPLHIFTWMYTGRFRI